MPDAAPVSPPPSPQALVICDAGHVDPATRKPYLLGLFDQLRGESFPLLQPQLTVYCSFTDARGRVPLRFRIIDADAVGPSLTEFRTELVAAHPLESYYQLPEFRNVLFPRPGEYRL